MESADWQIIVEHRKEDIARLEDLLAEEALAIANFELDEKDNRWRTTAYFADKPEIALPQGFESTLTRIEQKDWVAETQANFPPNRIGRFLILGAHHEGMGLEQPGAITLKLDAGAAFGTGEHATTEGCLQALEEIAKRNIGQGALSGDRASHQPAKRRAIGAPVFTGAVGVSRSDRKKGPHGAQIKNILDMGCGSGILGIAAAKMIPGASVLGVEIDPVATAVAAENVRRNRMQANCRMVTGNGYQSPWVQGEYRLIFANILAAPLVKFAPALAQRLAPGGYAILSGLLTTQANWVLNAHLAQGLALEKRIVIGDWTTLVINAPAPASWPPQ